MKRKSIISALVLTLIFGLLPGFGFAQEKDEKTKLKRVKTEVHKVGKDTFQLITWEDENGNLIYTIPDNVKNKEEVAKYADSLIYGEPTDISVNYYGWSRNLSKYDSTGYGKTEWSVSGKNYYEPLYPALEHYVQVYSGTLKNYYMGSNLADKIIVYYDYTFSGTMLEFSYPPSLSRSGSKVSWKSSPVYNVWYVTTTSHGAKATSNWDMDATSLQAGSDIYKGSYIYRPLAKASIAFPVD
jgi:hypothetical protein